MTNPWVPSRVDWMVAIRFGLLTVIVGVPEAVARVRLEPVIVQPRAFVGLVKKIVK